MRKTNPGLKVFFGTFTLPSCVEEDLGRQLDALIKGFTRLMRRAALKAHTIGVIRFVEFDFNRSTGMFHPHLHALIMVKATFMSKGYLSQKALLEMWQSAAGNHRATQISFKIIKPDLKPSLSLEKKVADTVRYAMKPIKPAEWTPASLAVLSKTIRNRRLCEFMGGFKPIMKRLRQTKTGCLCQGCLLQQVA